MRIHGKVDSNHLQITKELRELGISTQSLADLGFGCPDLLCGFRGLNYLFEIKDGLLRPSAKKLTELELGWHQRWRGQVMRVESSDDILRIVGLI